AGDRGSRRCGDRLRQPLPLQPTGPCERVGSRVEAAMIRREPLAQPVHAPTDQSMGLSPAWTGGGKRLFDLGVAVLCLVLLSPLLAAVALMVRLPPPAPALFPHVGLGRPRRAPLLARLRPPGGGTRPYLHR